MALMAVAIPLLPGKTDDWRKWVEELNGPRRQEFVDSRRRAGVRERTFLQSTPLGDLVIVTIEGDDPGRAFGQMMSADDAFSTWFEERAREFHGDVPAPTTEAPSELVLDTDELAGQSN
ncbi:MAG: hypothetical protein H0X16_00460 [Chloroflexi bacterium]|nr:hypothetical protein [Chloroflexota bacterium]